jgi:hypothetical protein
MLVALLALVMATTGSAVAASLITSAQIKNGTIQTTDISKKAQNALKGKRGATGQTGATGPAGAPGAKGDKGDAGTNGANGSNGAPGTARAYVLSDAAGAIIAAKSKNVVSITKVNTGEYCVKLDPSINAATVEGTVTPDYYTSPLATVIYIQSSRVGCSAVTNSVKVMVRKVTDSGGPAGTSESEVAADGGFFLLVP